MGKRMPYWVLSVYDLRRKEKALFHRTLLPTLPFQTKSDHIKPNQTFFGSLGFPVSSAGKESVCNAGDLGLVPALGRSPGETKGYPLQYSGLENSMDCIVHGVAKNQTQLNNFRSITQLLLEQP